MPLPKHALPKHDDSRGARYYETPIGRLPSVTTILEATRNQPRSRQWRSATGVGSPSAAIEQAAARGRSFHQEMEDFLENGVPGKSTYFQSVGSFLRTLEDVLLVEGPVWHAAGFAGTMDCVARVGGEVALIDWKTAREPKPPSWVVDQHLQVAAYRAAFQSLYGIPVSQCFVVFAFPNDEAQVLKTERIDDQYADFLVRLDRFRLQPGIAGFPASSSSPR